MQSHGPFFSRPQGLTLSTGPGWATKPPFLHTDAAWHNANRGSFGMTCIAAFNNFSIYCRGSLTEDCSKPFCQTYCLGDFQHLYHKIILSSVKALVSAGGFRTICHHGLVLPETHTWSHFSTCNPSEVSGAIGIGSYGHLGFRLELRTCKGRTFLWLAVFSTI